MNEEYLKGLTKEELIEIIYNETTCTYQLKNNWNELKKWLQANDIHYAEAIPFKETLRKMQELEQGKDE